MKEISKFYFGDTVVKYITDSSGAVGLMLLPADMESEIVDYRQNLDQMRELAVIPEIDSVPARPVDSLVQLKCVGDDYPGGFAQGRTMRNSGSVRALKFLSQDVSKSEDATIITTTLIREGCYLCHHTLKNYTGYSDVEVYTVFENISKEDISLEMLSSFSICGITPFDSEDASEKLYMHRFRASWSAEGRHECRSLEQMQLERSWSGAGTNCERFGHNGSKATIGFFPFLAVEDRQAGVFWGSQLAWSGSWQMELYRKDDAAAISGGLADREQGHWLKKMAPGESFTTPVATIATARNNIDAICQKLTEAQKRHLAGNPEVENDLPIIFNEWCTTWGTPEHSMLEKIADRLKDTDTKYLVIDAGWYKPDDGDWNNAQGDWEVNKQLFPNGLKAAADAIRQRGLIPGIWFEMETAGPLSTANEKYDHLFLKRDGRTIVSGERKFWDFRKPEVIEYMNRKVIDLLEECGFGYLKIDYNETIGIGADGAESLGEGLRQHIEGFYHFIDLVKKRIPEIVIENCSSGGQRLDTAMIAKTSMSSFSDAHETKEIPLIAANVQRLMLPAQSQIWAVLRSDDTMARLHYSLAATFLGRMCISGELLSLNRQQFDLMKQYQTFYGQVKDIINNGQTLRYGPEPETFRHPKGWQAILRKLPDDSRALLVIHSFDEPVADEVRIKLPISGWKIEKMIADENVHVEIQKDILDIEFSSTFTSAVVELKL
ncbi:MAG: alpha-galactosidase [Sedimentisphaeraceae bacterium JB056]